MAELGQLQEAENGGRENQTTEEAGSAPSDGGDVRSEEEDVGEEEGGVEIGEELDADEAEALKNDLGDDRREGKRRRAVADKELNSKGIASKAQPSSSSADEWRAMQSEQVPPSAQTSSLTSTREMVRVIRTYRFAGEEVREEKLLPASDPEAIAFMASEERKKKHAISAHRRDPDAAATPITSSKSAVSGGPRKRKLGGLAALSAAATSKPAKINTLEKSKMDWTKFKDTELAEAEKHQLDAQTKGGGSGLGSMKGYMERRNFLERVQDRLDGPGGSK